MNTIILATAAVVWIAAVALLVVAAIRAVDRSAENRRLITVAAQLADLRRVGLTVVPLPVDPAGGRRHQPNRPDGG